MPAFEILQALQTEVGSRRAGSKGERQAQSWLHERCQVLGLSFEADEFFYHGERYMPLQLLVILAWMLLVVCLRGFASSVVALAGLLYMGLIHKRLESRLAKKRSLNILAGLRRPFSEYAADPDKGTAVLIGAHYDTPRSHPPYTYEIMALIGNTLFPLWIAVLFLLVAPLLLAVVYALLALVVSLAASCLGAQAVAGALRGSVLALFAALQSVSRISGPWLTAAFNIIPVPILAFMVYYSLGTLSGRCEDSPGADDNGSGCAVVLELARRMRADPPSNVEVFFAWWGVEEQGLYGSRHAARRFEAQLDKAKFHFVNVDVVGTAGEMLVCSGQAAFPRRFVAPAVVERVERLAANLGIETGRAWGGLISSDHAEWLQRGFRNVVWLMRDKPPQPSLLFRLVTAPLRIPNLAFSGHTHIHSPDDTLERIDPQALEQAADLVQAYVCEVASSLSPPGKGLG